jgi:hypothetical protein
LRAVVIVTGYLAAAGVAVVIAWLVAGRHYRVDRYTDVDLGQLGGRHVSIVGNLSAFAVTGMVLLVTLGRNLPDASGLTTVLTMFFVAYMGYFATSLLFANVHDPDPTSTTHFDVTGAAYACAAVTLYFSTLVGWLALRPMFETFGLLRMVDVAGSLLTVATVSGYGLVAQHLHRSGYLTPRLAVLLPVSAIATAIGYAAIVGRLGLRSPDATLNLTIAAFVLGAAGFAIVTALPLIYRGPRMDRIFARYARFAVLGYAQGAIVLVVFLLLSVLGLA